MEEQKCITYYSFKYSFLQFLSCGCSTTSYTDGNKTLVGWMEKTHSRRTVWSGIMAAIDLLKIRIYYFR